MSRDARGKEEGIATVVGWAEWVALPDFGPLILRAKIDTGARTSALHTFQIEPFRKGKRDFVRFGIHPRQRRVDVAAFAEAPVIDRRMVRDSGGHEEQRYVIRTRLQLGPITRRVEITLTARENMQFRMLVGRSALGGFHVNPARRSILGTRKKMITAYNGRRKGAL